jgi:hypothetical protein
MGIASKQELPQRPVEKAPWSFKRMFPMAAMVSSFSKTFINPFDILLGFLVFVVGINELLEHRVSWMLWVFIILILLADLLERYKEQIAPSKKEEKKDKK